MNQMTIDEALLSDLFHIIVPGKPEADVYTFSFHDPRTGEHRWVRWITATEAKKVGRWVGGAWWVPLSACFGPEGYLYVLRARLDARPT